MRKKTNSTRSQNSDKQNIKHFRPVNVLPISGKTFERLIFNEVFRFFISYNLISKQQSDFKTDVSCINQLFSINLEIYQAFDDGLESRLFRYIQNFQ